MLLSLQDDAQEQSENLQVYLRVRPFTAAESGSGEAQVTHTHTPQCFAGIHYSSFLLLWVSTAEINGSIPVLYSSPRSMLDVIQLKTED